jgi:hypothetical protein
MTIHFAAARPGVSTILGRLPYTVPMGRALNDNARDLTDDIVLRAALRHFAQYGLSAAEHAGAKAECAFIAGDRDNYLWWLEICRTLDPRIAMSLRTQTSSIDALS